MAQIGTFDEFEAEVRQVAENLVTAITFGVGPGEDHDFSIPACVCAAQVAKQAGLKGDDLEALAKCFNRGYREKMSETVLRAVYDAANVE